MKAYVIVTMVGGAIAASYFTYSSMGDAGKDSVAYGKAAAAFASTASLRLNGPAEKLHQEIVESCSIARFTVLQKFASDAVIGQALSLVKINPILTLGDVNSILGSPIATETPTSELQCIRSLALFYYAFPDDWNSISSLSGDREALEDISSRFESVKDLNS